MSATLSQEDRMRFRSNSFAGFSLRDLAIALFYYKRPTIIAFLIPCLLGLVAAHFAHTTFIAQARLLVLYGSEYVFHPGNRDTGNDITLDRNQIIQGELQILQSPALAAEVLQEIGPATVYPGLSSDESPLRAAMSRFAVDLTSTSIPQSNVVELNLRNADRAVAIRVLNALIAHYLTYRSSIFEKGQPGGENVQRDEFADRLRKAEDDLAKFGIDHGITNLDEQMSLQLRLISENTTQQSVTAQQVGETSGRLNALHKEAANVPASVQIYAESARSQQTSGLTDSLVKLEIQRRDLLSRYQADFPLVRDVEKQIAAVRGQIGSDPSREAAITRMGRSTLYDDLRREEITLSSQLQGLQAKRAQLELEGVRLQARSDELASLARPYRDMQCRSRRAGPPARFAGRRRVEGRSSGRASAFERHHRGRGGCGGFAAAVAAECAGRQPTCFLATAGPCRVLGRAAHVGAQWRGHVDPRPGYLPRFRWQRRPHAVVRRRVTGPADRLAAQHLRHAGCVARGCGGLFAGLGARPHGREPTLASGPDWPGAAPSAGLARPDQPVPGAVRFRRDRFAGLGACVHGHHAGAPPGCNGRGGRGGEHARECCPHVAGPAGGGWG